MREVADAGTRETEARKADAAHTRTRRHALHVRVSIHRSSGIEGAALTAGAFSRGLDSDSRGGVESQACDSGCAARVNVCC